MGLWGDPYLGSEIRIENGNLREWEASALSGRSPSPHAVGLFIPQDELLLFYAHGRMYACWVFRSISPNSDAAAYGCALTQSPTSLLSSDFEDSSGYPLVYSYFYNNLKSIVSYPFLPCPTFFAYAF